MNHDVTRRRLLGVLAGTSIAGCISQVNTEPDDSPTPTGTPSRAVGTADASPTSSRCRSGYERLATGSYSTVTDELNGVVLTSSRRSVRSREHITFTLTNTADAERESGNRSHYDVQFQSDGTWQSIFWTAPDDTPAFQDDVVVHSPGDGFEWRLTMSAEGLSHDIQNGAGRLTVCTPLRPGPYRFVYSGAGPLGDSDGEAVLGVQFDVLGGQSE